MAARLLKYVSYSKLSGIDTSWCFCFISIRQR